MELKRTTKLEMKVRFGGARYVEEEDDEDDEEE